MTDAQRYTDFIKEFNVQSRRYGFIIGETATAAYAIVSTEKETRGQIISRHATHAEMVKIAMEMLVRRAQRVVFEVTRR